MARILDIQESFDYPRLRILFTLENERAAECFKASCQISVREIWFPLDLYHKRNILILDGPVNCPEDEQCIREVAQRLKNSIEQDQRDFRF